MTPRTRPPTSLPTGRVRPSLAARALLLGALAAAPDATAGAQAGARAGAPGAARLVVRAENPTAMERRDETVALAWDALLRDLPALQPARVRVLEEASGREVVSQALDADADGRPDSLLFQATLRPREARRFVVEAAAPATPAPPRAHATHVPERDDVAWENDRVAYRTYGQGLWRIEPQTRSSGIDVWTKRTRALVLDRWYAKGAGGYHRDDGEGADFYSVGLSLGGGGTAVWRGDSLHRPLNFRSHRILADGPIRALVELEYAPWDAGGVRVSETKRIQIDAGQHLFRSESVYRFEGAPELTYATGTVKRAGLAGASSRAHPWVWQATWGPVDPRQGGHGDLGTAVLVPADAVVGVEETADHFLVLARARSGVPAVHYVASGWTASGDFVDSAAWRAHVDSAARRLAQPIRVRVVVPTAKSTGD